MIITRRNWLIGLTASLIAAPAVLSFPLEMPVRGVPLIIDQDIIAELMRRLENPNLGNREPAPFYRASPPVDINTWRQPIRNRDTFLDPDFERVS